MKTVDEIRATTTRDDWFTDFRKNVGYAHYRFSGTITDKLVEMLGRTPTEEEIVNLVDDGLFNFGYTCRIVGRKFEGRVYTD